MSVLLVFWHILTVVNLGKTLKIPKLLYNTCLAVIRENAFKAHYR